MSFTYSGNPDTSTLDAVRFEVGDTTEKTQLLQDEEILYALKKEGTVLKAAARCAEVLGAKFAREETVRSATFSSNKGMVSEHYKDLAKKLRARSIRPGNFVCPSMTKDSKRQNQLDSELLLIETFKGVHNNSEAKTNGRQIIEDDKTSG